METDRVKKLVHSACQFSSAELFTAVGLLKQKANDRQADEYAGNLRAWAKQMKPGDRVLLQANGFKTLYGTEGTVKEVQLRRAPLVAAVGVEWDDQKGKTYWHRIKQLAKCGSLSEATIRLNRRIPEMLARIS
jgi:hypothetical protein